MSRIPPIVPITDLRQDAAQVLDRVRNSNEPLVITQRGRAAAVLMSVQQYERAAYERELLHALARGEQEIQAGKGHDMDSVFRAADAILARVKK